MVLLALVGCSRSQPAAPSSVAAPDAGAPVAAPAVVAAPAAAPAPRGLAPAAEVAPRPVSRQPSAVVNAPFAAPAGHSPVADAAQRGGRPADAAIDAFSLHAYRGQDADAPAIAAAGSTQLAARPLEPAPELLAVRTAPGALVAFHAAALGTFANGCQGITVIAGPDGLARVAFRAGQDGGSYDVMAVSPARSGVALFTIVVE